METFRLEMKLRRTGKLNSLLFVYLFVFQCVRFSWAINPSSKDSIENNEAIIQLSADSIHVVKTSETRLSNLEETLVEQEEKELIVALLASLDLQNHDDNEIEPINQIKFSVAPNSGFSGSITFLPRSLYFDEQPIAIPTAKSVRIVNEHVETLEIYSISGVNNEFYSSFSKEIQVEPNGGNVSIEVYFLPRVVGKTSRTLTIETNRGHFSYSIEGNGKMNSFRVFPIVTGFVPLNSVLEQTINFFNPFNRSLEINEIFTSDEHLVIELLSMKNSKNKISKYFHQNEFWRLEPFETKPIVKVNYVAHRLGILHGFVCIKTDSNDTIVVPVEIEVVDENGLYSPIDVFSFNPQRLISSTSETIRKSLYLFNYGAESATVTDVQFEFHRQDYLKILWKTIFVPAHYGNLFKVADLIIEPGKIPLDVDEINDWIRVTSILSNGTEHHLQIPLETRIFHGSIDFRQDQVMLYKPYLNDSKDLSQSKRCHFIELTNRFSTDIVIFKVTQKLNSSLSEFIQVNLTSPLIFLKTNRSTKALCVTLKQSAIEFNQFETIHTTIEVFTNISTVSIPFYLYNGFVTLTLPSDRSSGVVQWVNSNRNQFYVKSIQQSSSQAVNLFIVNNNPIEIQLKRIETDLAYTKVEIDSIEPLKSSLSTNKLNFLRSTTKFNSLTIPAESRVSITLTIRALGPIGSYNNSLIIETTYHTIKAAIQYSITDGMLELNSKKPIHVNVLVNRAGSTPLYLRNLFNRTVNLTSISFMNYGACLSMSWPNSNVSQISVDADQTLMLGMLKFDMQPLCRDQTISSSLRHFCRIEDHPEFSEQWKHYRILFESNQFNIKTLVNYREFFYEWVNRVRQQKIQSQIWLQTTHGNLSRSFSVDFHWPLVLDIMSIPQPSSPVTIDFQIVSVNGSKSQNILIDNPFPEPVSFAVELFETLVEPEKNETDNEQLDQIFNISTNFKQVQTDGRVFLFQLNTNERIMFSVSYRPMSAKKHSNFVLIRNNLTMLETILLRGEGGSGNLALGHRFYRENQQKIIMEMTDKNGAPCTGDQRNPKLLKILSLTNVGNMDAIIHDVSIGNKKCSGNGFVVESCTAIHLKPNEKYQMKILYQPDYGSSEVHELLVFNTNMGLMTFPIVVRIPPNIMNSCLKTIPRPVWELRTHCLCVCSLTMFIVFTFLMAIYDARRLFDQYLSRAEMRNQMQTSDTRIFDLKDLSVAVQDEQKKKDSADLTKAPRLDEPRKVKSVDLTTNESKAKGSERDRQPRNSVTNIEKSSNSNSPKTIRTNEATDNGDSASDAGNSKSTRNKSRRGNSDNGNSKNHQELSPKNSNNVRPKSSTTQGPSTKPKIPTPPIVQSTSVWSDDDDNEPFQIARPRRVSMKPKEGSTAGKTTNPTTDNQLTTKRPSLSEQPESRQQQDRDTREGRKPFAQTNVSPRNNVEQTMKIELLKAKGKTKNLPLLMQNSDLLKLAVSQAKLNFDEKPRKSRRPPRGRNPIRQAETASMITKLASVENNPDANRRNNPTREEEKLFAQIVEQLRAAGLPSSKNSCSMSIRSRCSSAPPSEHGGVVDDDDDDDEPDEDLIDWDDPVKPDDDFSRYANQTEQFLVTTNNMDETQNDHDDSLQINETDFTNFINTITMPRRSASFTPLAATMSEPSRARNKQILESQVIPAPIQRPNKLPWPTTTNSFGLNPNTLQSPTTPDVLVQINHILDHQNSIQSLPMTPSASNGDGASTPVSEISTPNISWTSFAQSSWPSNIQSVWSMNTTTNDNSVSRKPSQNPFVLKKEQSSEKTAIWPTILGTVTPNTIPADLSSQEASIWNEFISGTGSSSLDSSKTSTDVTPKFWPTNTTMLTEPSATAMSTVNGEQAANSSTFWNPASLNGSQSGNLSWWSKPPSNENNKLEQDQSRWDFAR